MTSQKHPNIYKRKQTEEDFATARKYRKFLLRFFENSTENSPIIEIEGDSSDEDDCCIIEGDKSVENYHKTSSNSEIEEKDSEEGEKEELFSEEEESNEEKEEEEEYNTAVEGEEEVEDEEFIKDAPE